MNTMKKNGGFTLVELIIVIAILAILSSVAVAGYSSYIKRANNSAVLSELNNISTAAALANAEAGGIASIKVQKGGTEAAPVLKITITADSTFADNFATLMTGSIPSFAKDSSDTNDKDNTFIATVNLPSAWSASEYADDGEITWTRGGSWPKAK